MSLLDSAENTGVAGTTHVLPSVATTGTNVRLIAVVAARRVGGIIVSPPSGWTSRMSGLFSNASDDTRYHFMDRAVASGAGSPFADTVTADDAGTWGAIQIAIRAGVASPHTGSSREDYACEPNPTNTATFSGGYAAVAGQILVAAVYWNACAGSTHAGESPWPVGWTRIRDGGSGATSARMDAAYKIAAGGETGVTVTPVDDVAWWSDVVIAAYDAEETAGLEDCDAPVAFDVYSLGTATSPALTYLATLCDAFDKSFRVELDGTGSGRFSINRSSADATAAILGDGDGDVRYVQVRIPAINATAIFGFFLETGDFRLLDSDEEGGETLTFSGPGSLAYLGFATMLAHSYITGGMDPYTGLWRLYLAGTGSKPGQMLGRLIEEAQDADRPQKPLPLLTDTFDYTNDSNAAAWASSTATNEFAAQINESVLSVVGRLIGTGAITVQMSPTFVLSAYNTFGTDRSSATFLANKIRFVGGTNIAEGLTRQIRPSRVATHVNVYGESEASVVSSLADAATRVTREAGLSSFGTDTTALDAVGDADLAERLLRSESLSVRIALGSDDSTGLYLPGPSGSTAGKFWVGDTVTLHTGTGEFDYNNASFPVAAINVIEGPGVSAVTDLEVVVELGSTKIGDAAGGGSSNLLSASPGGGSSAVPPHTHPGASSNAELNFDGGQSIIFPHGSMGATETFDPVNGNVHTGTLNANCVFTLTGPTGPRACLLELRILASGTRTWTWPGSVTWVGGAAPDPPADTLTKVIILETLDGGTSWIGGEWGGGSSVADLDDLSDVTITSATLADRLRFDGSVWRNSALIWRPVTVWDPTSGLWVPLVDGSGNAIMAEA